MLSKKYTVSDWSRIWLETYKKGCIAEKTFYNYDMIKAGTGAALQDSCQ